MQLTFKKTGVLRAIQWQKSSIIKASKTLGFILLFLSIGSFFLFSASTIIGASDLFLDRILAGWVLSLSLSLFWFELSAFSKRIINPQLDYPLHDLNLRPDYLNLGGFLTSQAADICLTALKKAKKEKTAEADETILLSSLISAKSPQIEFITARCQINLKNLKKQVAEIRAGYTGPILGIKEIIKTAGIIAENGKKEKIDLGDILVALANKSQFFQKILTDYDLTSQDIANLSQWYERLENTKAQAKKFWTKENLEKKGSLGRDFSSGYTLNLDKYSVDLKLRIAKKGNREIVGHEKEAKEIETILAKNELNNVLVVGEPGVGRKSVVEAVAQRAFTAETPDSIDYKRILLFNPSLVATSSDSQDAAESALEDCFYEASTAGNIILMIDDFHNYVESSNKPGTLNIIGVLSKYLQLSSFRIIAVTSYDGLHQIIEKNSALLSQFEKVEVGEINREETFRFLENYVPFFEQRNKIFVSYKALRAAINLSDRFMPSNPFPDKALRVIDEAVADLASQKTGNILEENHIKRIITEKTEIPVEDLEENEKSSLLNLEKLIHKRIVNQKEAVRQISRALRRARADIHSRKGPMGSFLFLGPTGVGKTETAKALTEIYFKSAKKMIRLDMSEFQNTTDIERIIGSFDNPGVLTTQVKETPFSLILLDEIEKAHPKILNLFLQVIDEGFITDGAGRKVNFQNTMIISTSNAGAEIIRQDLKDNKALDIIKDDLLDVLFKQNIFSPEFINRFDSVIIFKPLSKSHLLEIANLMLSSLANNLKDKGITLIITPELKESVVEISYNPTFGAREMKRAIQDKIEDNLAKAILSGKLKRGQFVEIDPSDFNLIIKNQNIYDK